MSSHLDKAGLGDGLPQAGGTGPWLGAWAEGAVSDIRHRGGERGEEEPGHIWGTRQTDAELARGLSTGKGGQETVPGKRREGVKPEPGALCPRMGAR